MVEGSELAALLLDARARTLDLVSDLTDEQLVGPRLPIVNQLLWEIGHVAWFQERWVLRHLRDEGPVRADADALWDSFRVRHDTRWDLGLPSRTETLLYMNRVLERVLERLPAGEVTAEEEYFHRLVLFHEDMHDEAFVYTRQTLAYPPPRVLVDREAPRGGPWPGDAEVPGGVLRLGAETDAGFVFDNEKWAHDVEVAPFSIARAPVTNADFAAFVESGGYAEERWWSAAGRAWRSREKAEHPVYWIRDGGGRWLERRFDGVNPLDAHDPVLHVCWYEAEAWCNWARRRLPTEAEWEMAASCEPGTGAAGRVTPDYPKRRFPWGNMPPSSSWANLSEAGGRIVPVDALPEGDSAFGCRQMIGNVWEWTASSFAPFPGFTADPYKEYSEPWFDGGHKVLRGGAFATQARLIRNTWRNFYTPDRRDVLAGFRTCAR